MSPSETVLDAALHDCLEWIARGETPEAALARFPGLDEELRPLLWAADSIAALPGLPSGERAAMRLELEQLARAARAEPGSGSAPPPNGTLGPGSGGWPLLVAAGLALGAALAGYGLLRGGPGGPVGGLLPAAGGTPTAVRSSLPDVGSQPPGQLPQGASGDGEITTEGQGTDEDAGDSAQFESTDSVDDAPAPAANPAAGGAIGAGRAADDEPDAAADPPALAAVAEGERPTRATETASASRKTEDAQSPRPSNSPSPPVERTDPAVRATGGPVDTAPPARDGRGAATAVRPGDAPARPVPSAAAVTPAGPPPATPALRRVTEFTGLSGLAVDSKGRALEDAFVLAYREDGAGPWLVDVDMQGTWRLDLDSGVYRLRLMVAGVDSGWYQGASRRADATPLQVLPGQALIGIEFGPGGGR